MKMGGWLPGLTAALAICVTGAVDARPISSVNVPALANRADLIIVGRTSVPPHSGPEWTETLLIKADRVIKGGPGAATDAVSASVNVRQNPPIADRQYGIFFLNVSDGRYEFTDPDHPFLIAAPFRQPSAAPGGSAVDQIAAELVHVLATSPADLLDPEAGVGNTIVSDSGGKVHAIYGTASFQLHSIPPASKSALLWALVNKLGPSRQRMWAVLNLLLAGDAGALDAVKSDLLNPDADSLGIAGALGQQIGAVVNAPEAVPALKTLLGSSVVEVRRGAACALRSAATKDVIAPLSGMLQDQDQMVRYYAATGLAVATRQLDHLVSVDGYRQNESEHLAYWHKWADAHRN